jgi:FkbM family methyltransferase
MKFGMEIARTVNKILGANGRIIKVRFDVDCKEFEAYVQDDECFGAVKDVLLNREYEYLPEFELTNFKNKRVVDAGAHVGFFSLAASRFAREVIAIEPHPINYKLLKLNLDRNKTNNVITINKALWYETSKVRFHESFHTGGGSVFDDSSKSYEVQTVTLEDIVDEIGDIDLLKIDIEGAEFKVLEKSSAARNLVCEVHLKKGDLQTLARTLTNRGLSIRIFNPPLAKGKERSYDIVLHDFLKLKSIRSFVQAGAFLLRKVNTDLALLFAKANV